jgi:hypothetical protein
MTPERAGSWLKSLQPDDRRLVERARSRNRKLSNPNARDNFIKVSLSDQELARLDELRGDEERAVYLRRLLQAPPDGSETATHGESLAILTRLARDGKVSAAIALERALRGAEDPSDDWLERLVNGN